MDGCSRQDPAYRPATGKGATRRPFLFLPAFNSGAGLPNTRLMATPTSSTQQLAEFLAVVSAAPDYARAARLAVERAAEGLAAEVAAIVRDGVVEASIGFPEGEVPTPELVAAVSHPATLLPGLGRCHTTAAAFDDARAAWLVIAR